MLIRSQDKERIMDFARASVGIDHEVSEDNDIWISIVYSENACGLLGKYSSKEKAIKVLNMIQEAYADFESAKITSTGLTAAAYTGNYDTSESVAYYGIKMLKDYTEMIRESVVFQMPEDSEVEV